MKRYGKPVLWVLTVVLSIGLSFVTVGRAFADFCTDTCSSSACWSGNPFVTWGSTTTPSTITANASTGEFSFTMKLIWNFEDGPIGADIFWTDEFTENVVTGVDDPLYTPSVMTIGCSCACGEWTVQVDGELDDNCLNGTLRTKAEFYTGFSTISTTKTVTINESCP